MSNIVWIDDDYKLIGALLKLVEKDGHTVFPYGSLKEAEDNIDSIIKSDVIILDIILPPVEDNPYQGLSLLRALRETHNYQGPVIVCSRVINPNVHRELKELGVSQEFLLIKPVLPSKMKETVNIALESSPKQES